MILGRLLWQNVHSHHHANASERGGEGCGGWVGHETTLESDPFVPVGLKFGLQQTNHLTLIRRASRS